MCMNNYSCGFSNSNKEKHNSKCYIFSFFEMSKINIINYISKVQDQHGAWCLKKKIISKLQGKL